MISETKTVLLQSKQQQTVQNYCYFNIFKLQYFYFKKKNLTAHLNTGLKGLK